VKKGSARLLKRGTRSIMPEREEESFCRKGASQNGAEKMEEWEWKQERTYREGPAKDRKKEEEGTSYDDAAVKWEAQAFRQRNRYSAFLAI